MDFIILENEDAGISVHPKLKEFIFELNSEYGISKGLVIPKAENQIFITSPFITQSCLRKIIDLCSDNDYGIYIDEHGLTIYYRGDENG